MSSPIKKVAVAGAAGNIGAPAVAALLAAGFSVSALTRHGSDAVFPDHVTPMHVSYDSIDELTAALRGFDAVVSCLGAAGLAAQPSLVEASAAAGVQHFIPAEYGADTMNEAVRAFPILQSKLEIQALLEEKKASTGMAYTLLFTGLFLDWGLENGMIVDVRGSKARLYDGGDVPISFTTTTTIGQAITACLVHPETTRNRAIYVQDIATTQNHIIELAKSVDPAKKWETSAADTVELARQSQQAFERKDPDISSMYGSIFRMYFGGKPFNQPFQKLDNEALGIRAIDDAGLKALISKIMQN